MHNILVINSSASDYASVSRMLVGELVLRLVESYPQFKLTCRDVGEDPPPHLTSATISGVRGVARTSAERATRALSDRLIVELQSADLVVIGAPMYNFGIPSSLRTWFDHVLRPSVTFAYDEDGPQGLLAGKRAIVIVSRGEVYSDGPAKTLDFQEPYLKQLLSFIGITDVDFIHAEGVDLGPESRDAALAAARERITQAAMRHAA